MMSPHADSATVIMERRTIHPGTPGVRFFLIISFDPWKLARSQRQDQSQRLAGLACFKKAFCWQLRLTVTKPTRRPNIAVKAPSARLLAYVRCDLAANHRRAQSVCDTQHTFELHLGGTVGRSCAAKALTYYARSACGVRGCCVFSAVFYGKSRIARKPTPTSKM